MNNINVNIQVTVESVYDFYSNTLPTLDFQLWLEDNIQLGQEQTYNDDLQLGQYKDDNLKRDDFMDGKSDGTSKYVKYKYFEKPGGSKYMIMEQSAMPHNMKTNSLV